MKKLEILSNKDLVQFKDELIEQLKGLQSSQPLSKWLRSKDVRKMLGISDSTLQTMRINGTIPSYKLGTSWFYKHDEIVAALEAGKTGKRGSND